MKPIIAKNIERIFWLGVIIVALLLFKRCSDKKSDQIKAIQASAKELEQQRKADSIQFSRQVTRWQDSIYNAGLNSDLQAKVIKEAEKKLQASQSRVAQLTNIIRADAGTTPTDTGVLVSVAYKDACDSLPVEIDKMNAALLEKDTAFNDLVDLMNYEVVYRDSLIESGKGYIDSLRRDYNAQKILLNQALKVGKPRGRLLGGVGLIGNETNPLGGTKINLAYQSKGGKQYQIGGILMRGGVWYEAGVLITLIK